MTISPPPLHEALVQSASTLKAQRVEHLFDTTPTAPRIIAARCRDHAGFLKAPVGRQGLVDPVGAGTPASPAGGFHLAHRGDMINSSEKRPALHTLLRGTARERHPERSAAVEETLARMALLVERIHSGESVGFTGKRFTPWSIWDRRLGSGPRLICEALKDEGTPLSGYFVANIDPDDLDRTLVGLDPETTLFVICSKSFTTEETLSNARRATAWLKGCRGAGGRTGTTLDRGDNTGRRGG
ncbi:MAG: hypothetical protein CM15mP74_18060 [Halieaceae bacterium]|nr:MAG: hypothetical protein CM15mP74_18060 [Halieaceae bacterium]